MATGELAATHTSPIAQAIALAETGTTGEIRVHLSKRFYERDPFGRARRIFVRYGMTRTSQRNAVLLYVNLRRRKISVVGDKTAHEALGQRFWETLVHDLQQDLRATHHEKAIALAVTTIGDQLKKHFPALDRGSKDSS